MSGHVVNEWQDGRCLMPDDPVGYMLDRLIERGVHLGQEPRDEDTLLRSMRDLAHTMSGNCGPAQPNTEWRSEANPHVEVSCDFYRLGPDYCQKHRMVTANEILARFRERQVGEQLPMFTEVAA